MSPVGNVYLVSEVSAQPEAGSAVAETILAATETQLAFSTVKVYKLLHSCSPIPSMRCQVLSLLEN